MSKAFTKEDAGDDLDGVPRAAPWPAGVKNYLTPAGYERLVGEIEWLRDAAPRASGRRKVELAERLQARVTRLEAAEVVDLAKQPRDVVRFGATVTVEDDDGGMRDYRIVGVDEADPKNGAVSWRSPIARALTGRRVGDSVTVRTPAGDEELIVAHIAYEAE